MQPANSWGMCEASGRPKCRGDQVRCKILAVMGHRNTKSSFHQYICWAQLKQTYLCRAVHAAQQGAEGLHFQKVVQVLMPQGPQHGHVQLS